MPSPNTCSYCPVTLNSILASVWLPGSTSISVGINLSIIAGITNATYCLYYPSVYCEVPLGPNFRDPVSGFHFFSAPPAKKIKVDRPKGNCRPKRKSEFLKKHKKTWDVSVNTASKVSKLNVSMPGALSPDNILQSPRQSLRHQLSPSPLPLRPNPTYTVLSGSNESRVIKAAMATIITNHNPGLAWLDTCRDSQQSVTLPSLQIPSYGLYCASAICIITLFPGSAIALWSLGPPLCLLASWCNLPRPILGALVPSPHPSPSGDQ